MSLPGNGIFVVRGEMSTLMTAMRRGSRWNSSMYVDEDKDVLMKLFVDLKQILNCIEDLRLIDANVYLTPFLEVIQTDETTGAVTSLALAAINKFLSYGLIDPTSPNLPAIVDKIVDAVTHARFMGTDQSSDGVTLLRVVEVLHTLMHSPEGSALTNDAVCDVMLSCFKICFEPRLNELLRRAAEQALKDMVLLLFMRLPQFSEDRSESGLLKKFQMMTAAMDQNKKQRNKKHSITNNNNNNNNNNSNSKVASNVVRKLSATAMADDLKTPPLATTPATPVGNILDMQGKISQTPTGVPSADAKSINSTTTIPTTTTISNDNELKVAPVIAIKPATPPSASQEQTTSDVETTAGSVEQTPSIEDAGSNEFINALGVRFTQQTSLEPAEGKALLPYGLNCIQELFRFLILLCNPMDKQNTDTMIHMGLSLLTVAFEVGADNIGKYDTLLELVADDLCRNLIALLNSERLSIFAADLRVCFLLFESLRGHLKFQMEAYLKKITEIIASDNPKTPYEMRELALDNLLQLWRIPNFVAELYFNYDCDLYSSDQFESLTTLLSKHTLSATNVVLSTHIIAMDALLSVIEHIERNCVLAKNIENINTIDNGAGEATASTKSTGGLTKCHSRQNSDADVSIIMAADVESCQDDDIAIENISKYLENNSNSNKNNNTINSCLRWRPTIDDNNDNSNKVHPSCEHLLQIKHKKRLLTQGTEIFNQRPEKGIQYLQENGILDAKLNASEIAQFLRENSSLDKKMIGEFISKKKNVDSKILQNFVDSFDFVNLRIDQALRLYLETFRLPGEAPLIFLVLEHFADHWHKQNGEPFANVDAAFSLAYAIIMLNMDQHNLNAKRLNVPMTQEEFLKNLRGLNGGIDFDQEMLATIFQAIKNEEIVMPAEQTGLVRENYLWKVLLRRGTNSDGVFHYVQGAIYDLPIFSISWGAALSALSFMFDKSSEQGYQRTLAGFSRCAAISSHYNLHANFDALVLTLCKFTTLLQTPSSGESGGQGTPAHNDITQAVNFGLNVKAQAAMRTVFALVHDYGDSLREGWKHILELYVQLFRLKLLPKSLMEVEDFCAPNGKVQLLLEKPREKQEAGLFSSLYSYLSSEGQREPTYEEQEIIKYGKKCIKECQLDLVIQETKFLQLESLQELIKHVLVLLKPPHAHKSIAVPYAEDTVVFWMEFLVKVVIHNRDRMLPMWPSVRDQMYLLLMGGTSCGYEYLLNRSIVAVLKLAIYLMRNEELCPIVLQSLKMLLMLKPAILLYISKQISIGIYELLKTSAQNIHSEQDWQIIFNILECVGAGAVPPEITDASLPTPIAAHVTNNDSEEISTDSEFKQPQQAQQAVGGVGVGVNVVPTSSSAENWILVNKESESLSRPQSPQVATLPTLNSLLYSCQLIEHSPFALFKCWDSLAFIVRNVAHITPYNFESCVRCIRTFVEACRDGGLRQRRNFENNANKSSKGKTHNKERHANQRLNNSNNSSNNNNNGNNFNSATNNGAVDSLLAAAASDDALLDDDEALTQRYETLSIQLLDIMYTLYTRTAQIFRWWAEEDCAVPQCSALWAQGWCPLLQGIARLAMDRRREVRTYAISCLQQRALLVHDLQALSGTEWASCFQQVLFPLLNELLPESGTVNYLDSMLLEESRIRTATIMSKVFLHHLTPLIELGDTFNVLWLDILNYVEKFMKVGSDMLSEQMQEILKNMLLVMHSVRVFHNKDSTLNMPLWELTWQRIGEFLPNLKEELFSNEGNRTQLRSKVTTEVTISTPTTISPNVNVVQFPTQDMNLIQQPEVLQLSTDQQQQQQQEQQRVGVQSANTTIARSSPVDSPRNSIIFRPLESDMLQQGANIPMIVPQIQPHPQLAALTMPDANYTSKDLNKSPAPLPDVINISSNTNPENNLAQLMDLQIENKPELFKNYNSFAIDMSDIQQNSTSYQYGAPASVPQQQISQENPIVYSGLPITASNMVDEQSQHYQESITSLSSEFVHQNMQLQQQQQQLQQQISTLPSSLSNEADAMPSVPMSHLLAGNQYPSLPNKIPNAAIVHSFAPVCVQQPAQQAGLDIYQEYVQNPYNLTLQESQPIQMHQHQLQQQNLQQQVFGNTALSLPTAANYFNNNTVDSTSIPPGSEMLFGQP